jgi:threonyl-tRNA synthetase
MRINDLILSTYEDFGFEKVVVKLSTRPEKRVGTDAMWDHAEQIMSKCWPRSRRSPAAGSRPASTRARAHFYGPKFEYVLRDAIGRDWQCGTTQVDFNLPERFGAFYIDKDSEKKKPVMIHRAICGSHGAFLGILIENYAGHIPLVVRAAAGGRRDHYPRPTSMRRRCAAAAKAGLKVETDLRNEKINYKVREHSVAKVPVILVVRQARGGRRHRECPSSRFAGSGIEDD